MDTIKTNYVFGKTIEWTDISAYSNYSLERNKANKSKFWTAIISDYHTAKNMKRHFLNCSATDNVYLIDFTLIHVNDIIQIREDERRSYKYTDRYEINAFVKSINESEVELIVFDTLYQSIKYQHEQLNL